jgi:hypothetical protein
MWSFAKRNPALITAFGMCLALSPAATSFWCSCNISEYIAEGSLEVKLPTIWTDGKAAVGRVRGEKRRRRRNKIREEKESEERRCRCAKGIKVAKLCVLPVFWGSGVRRLEK